MEDGGLDLTPVHIDDHIELGGKVHHRHATIYRWGADQSAGHYTVYINDPRRICPDHPVHQLVHVHLDDEDLDSAKPKIVTLLSLYMRRKVMHPKVDGRVRPRRYAVITMLFYRSPRRFSDLQLLLYIPSRWC